MSNTKQTNDENDYIQKNYLGIFTYNDGLILKVYYERRTGNQNRHKIASVNDTALYRTSVALKKQIN